LNLQPKPLNLIVIIIQYSSRFS